MKYLVKKEDEILIVNISQEIDNQHHLLRKEQGFRNYFADKKLENAILKIDIKQTDYNYISNSLEEVLKNTTLWRFSSPIRGFLL